MSIHYNTLKLGDLIISNPPVAQFGLVVDIIEHNGIRIPIVFNAQQLNSHNQVLTPFIPAHHHIHKVYSLLTHNLINASVQLAKSLQEQLYHDAHQALKSTQSGLVLPTITVRPQNRTLPSLLPPCVAQDHIYTIIFYTPEEQSKLHFNRSTIFSDEMAILYLIQKAYHTILGQDAYIPEPFRRSLNESYLYPETFELICENAVKEGLLAKATLLDNATIPIGLKQGMINHYNLNPLPGFPVLFKGPQSTKAFTVEQMAQLSPIEQQAIRQQIERYCHQEQDPIVGQHLREKLNAKSIAHLYAEHPDLISFYCQKLEIETPDIPTKGVRFRIKRG